jgi:flagellar protein FliO/FliZ
MDVFFNDMSVPVKFALAFIVVFVVLGAGGLLRRLTGANLTALGRRSGQQPRLAMIDAATVDGRRRLVLVRRDNTEHLLLIGGPTDIVVEPNIGRTAAATTTGAATAALAPVPAAKPSPTFEPVPRPTLSLEGTGWPPAEPTYSEPPPPRPVRESVRPPSEPVLHSPPSPPPYEPVFQIPPPPEPKRMPAAPLPPQSAESNLAEMAQRLEAALRRPIKPVEPVPSSPPPGHSAGHSMRVHPSLREGA